MRFAVCVAVRLDEPLCAERIVGRRKRLRAR
jgi:hypothetical protein